MSCGVNKNPPTLRASAGSNLRFVMPPRGPESNTYRGILIPSQGLESEIWQMVRPITYDLAIGTYYNLLCVESQEHDTSSTENCDRRLLTRVSRSIFLS